jgi:hypothetical protein
LIFRTPVIGSGLLWNTRECAEFAALSHIPVHFQTSRRDADLKWLQLPA